MAHKLLFIIIIFLLGIGVGLIITPYINQIMYGKRNVYYEVNK